jgi:hypothetical protein
MDNIPNEILLNIPYDELSYRALLSIPRFARLLTPGLIVDFQIKFGYDVKIKKYNCGVWTVWTKYGKKHRRDIPAVMGLLGEIWYSYGRKHRTGGPAVIRKDTWGNIIGMQWCQHDNLHRLDGPAIITKESQQWYINNIRHRGIGPAIICGDYIEYWVHGTMVNPPVLNNK